jgi:hypothetical protein
MLHIDERGIVNQKREKISTNYISQIMYETNYFEKKVIIKINE